MSSKSTKIKADKIKPADFVHLHLHSHYSLLDGLSKIPAILDRVSETGMTSVALTDHGTMSGVIEFYEGCLKRNLKPIIGIEAYLASRTHLDKEVALDRRITHLILLAQTNQGYKNLMKLSTIAYLDGFYYKPRIDKKLLEKYSEGLIVLSGCMGGEIGEALQAGNVEKAEEVALWYKKVFKDRFYLEIQDHGLSNEEQGQVNEQILKLSEKLKIEPVLTSDSHYLKPGDKEAHEILLCIQTRRFLDDPTRMSLKDFNLDLGDPVEIIKRWKNICPQAILNTKKIAQSCEVDIKFDQILLPKFDVPATNTPFKYLQELVFKGLAKRYLDLKVDQIDKLSTAQIKKQLDPVISQRADYELEVINKMDYSSYFLIVWDFCRWGKNENILFGPGRGSAAGSIISYSLDITTIDPIKYGLLFERFLNSQRISMPDIDIDIEDRRREEVIQYVIEKYGAHRVANIATFGTMASRNALRDVARVLKVSYVQADQLAKMLPPPLFGRSISLKESLENEKNIKMKYDSDPQIKRVYDLAMQLEGTIRSHGVHAAGVVIAPEDIVNLTPLEINSKGVITTQYSMNPIEKLGLLKIDFLGLSNLTTIRNTLRIIKKVYKKTIDIHNLDLEDKKTYKLLAKANTTGVFQLESRGVRQYLQRLNPTNFEDIAAILALYRPGPLTAGLVEKFIERRHGRQKVSVSHPAFEPALKNTYGVLVYQEQVMHIGRDVCGLTGMEADELRKAIGKKQRDIMRKMKQKFIEGGVKKHQIDRQIMEDSWQEISGFADYAFNRSHAVSYGMITFQTAYLKAHFTAAFMATVMTANAGDISRLKSQVSECNLAGIQVLPPDINESFPEFAIVQSKDKKQAEKIRFGLEVIKNASVNAVKSIVEIRDQGGPYKDLIDFIERQKDNQHLNRKTLESLIKAGAFDCFSEREKLLSNLDNIIGAINRVAKDAVSKQVSLLEIATDDESSWSNFEFQATNYKPVDLLEKLAWEKELLGIYISQHPLDIYQDNLSDLDLSSLIDLSEDSHISFTDGERRKVGGIIANLKPLMSKVSKRKMASLEFEDKSNSVELIVSPPIFEKYNTCWQEGNVLILTLRASLTDYHGNALLHPNWSIEAAQKIEVNQPA